MQGLNFERLMRIAINTRFLLNDYLEGYGYFMHECFMRITQAHPEHQFIFIFDRPYDEKYIYSENVIPVVAGPPARHPLLWAWWYDVRIPGILKKYKADVFVSADGHCSLRTSIPQCLVIHDLAFLHYPQFSKSSHVLYYKHYLPRFINKAKLICTVSDFTKKDIGDRYDVDASKISVVYNAARPGFKPISEAAKNAIKDKYTGGKEYFLYTGAIHPRKNLINLLKAFSKFKKRQKSSFKLVIAGRMAWKYEAFQKSLETFRFRSDVIVTGYLPGPEITQLTAAAYAMVYPSLFEGFGVPVVEAMQSGVPVITSAGTAMAEVAGDAALYANPADADQLGAQMMLIYTNETLRDELISKGLERSDAFSLDETARRLWQSICNCIS